MIITSLINTVAGIAELFRMTNMPDLINKLDLVESKGSISKFTSTFVVEPVIVIDTSISSIDKKNDIINHQLKIFTSYILQIFYKSVNLDGVEPRIAFDLISSGESNISNSVRMVADYVGLESTNMLANIKATEAGLESKTLSEDLSSAHNYVADVEFVTDDRTVKMPIIIKPIIVESDISNITEMLDKERRSSLWEALEDMTYGLRSVIDVITSTSLIEQARKEKFDDSNQLIALMRERSARAKTKAKYGAMGFQEQYCMFIIDDGNIPFIESELGSKLKNKNARNAFFEKTLSFILTSVDTSYEQITTYIDGQRDGSIEDFSDLKSKSKDGNADLLKAIIDSKPIF